MAGGRLAGRVRRQGLHPGRAVHLLRRVTGRRLSHPVPEHQHGRAHHPAVRQRRPRRTSSSDGSWPVRCTSRSATRSPTPAPTWPPFAPVRYATATTGWSTGRSSSPASPTTPTTCGWPPGPILMPRPQGHHHVPGGHRRSGLLDPAVRDLRADSHTTATFYDDVRVPDSMRVGEVNGGWGLITNQLNHERVSLFPGARLTRIVDDAVTWARSTTISPTDAGSSTRSGCRSSWPSAGPWPATSTS